jgi:hypothetical protein
MRIFIVIVDSVAFSNSVIEHGEIRVAEATVADFDFDFFRSEWTGIGSKRF